MSAESVILCEGYHDREFWSGWLTHSGCAIPKVTRPGAKRPQVLDDSGRPVAGGQYGFRSKSGNFIRIIPCLGVDEVLPALRDRLKDRTDKPVARIVVNVDPDTDAHATGIPGLRVSDVLSEVRKSDPQAAARPDGDIAVDIGATLVSVVRWEAVDPAAPGIPKKQTLERLVCCALAAARPAWAGAVGAWLAGRPDTPGGTHEHKSHAYSYLAGWFADGGCDAFYKRLWLEPAFADVRPQLESRLTASGALRIAQLISE